MKIFIRLCGSIARRNKGFTAGIFIMSVLSVAIAFLGANFGPSSNDTIMGFLADSGMPDAVYVTDVMPGAVRALLEDIPDVSCVSPGFIYDTNMQTDDGSLYSVRVFRREADAPFTDTVHEAAACEAAEPTLSVSSEFAAHNGIHAGDRLSVITPTGKCGFTVEAIVSNPETMSCVKDDFSAYESYQFAYLYVRSADFDRIVPVADKANQWMIYFDEDLSAEQQKERMGQIRETLDGHIVSESFVDESEALNSIRDDLHTISVLCSFIPGIIWLISLGFNFVFIKIIVENQRKIIGLLRALGFTVRRVVLIFAAYTVFINLPALLCGIVLGSRLLHICLGVIAAAEGILEATVTISPALTSAMLLIVFVIGIAAALMSAGTIAKIDPVEAYGGTERAFSEPPALIRAMRTDAFFKISAASIVRNSKRQIVGALCITACIISMCVGFEGVQTIGHPIDAVYGGRYRYDLMVRGIDEDAVSKIERQLDGVTAAEPAVFFSAELLGKSVRVATTEEDDELTVLTDAAGNRLFPQDGIIIDEMRAKLNGISVGDVVTLDGQPLAVTGIARQILYPVMYVSPQSAKELGHGEPNYVLLRLEEGEKLSGVEQQIAALSDGAYLVEFASQKENIRSGFMAMRTVMFCFAVLAFAIGSLLVLNISVIDFNESRYRYAALRALGTPIGRIGRISALQNLFRVGMGIAAACPLCYVCTTILLGLLSGASQQYVMVNYTQCLLLSCLIPLLYVLLGTIVSLRRIRKMDFCGCLNELA